MKTKTIIPFLVTLLLLSGCSRVISDPINSISTDIPKELSNTSSKDTPQDNVVSEEIPEDITEQPPAIEEFRFVDVLGENYVTELRSDFPKNSYDKSLFRVGETYAYYEKDPAYTFRQGIDVSHHQGDKIDWKKVADAKIEFAIVRIGYRGYTIGNVCEDKYGIQNIKGALENGLDVGAYFFSQAIDEKEAIEEAEFVIELLSDNGLTPEHMKLPIVFDPETIRKDDARTDEVTGEQFTKNTRAFCDKIREAGYLPMIYSNMIWEAYVLDLSQLTDIPVWYADYEPAPQTPYAFSMWQYSESIEVPGIPGKVDGNLLLVPVE